MTEEEHEDAVAQVRRVLSSGKTFHFWLCPKASDGEPLLLLDKKQGPLLKRARAARKTAQVKVAAEGTVSLSSAGELVFVNAGKLACKKVSLIFRSGLATDEHLKKIAPSLRAALVLTPDEFEAQAAVLGVSLTSDEEEEEREAEADAGGDGPFERQLALARRKVRDARDVLDEAHEVVRDLRARVVLAEAEQAEAPGDSGTEHLQFVLDNADELVQKALTKAYDGLVVTVKPLWAAALEVTGGAGPVHDQLLELRQQAKALKQSDLAASIDLMSQLEVRLQEVVEGPPAEEADEDEADVPEPEAEPEAEAGPEGVPEDGPEGEPEAEPEDEPEAEPEEEGGARALLAGLEDAESRWAALDEPEELGGFLERAVAAYQGGDLETARKVLDEEIAWRLTRDERVAEARETIVEATGGGVVAGAQLAITWRAAVQEARAEVEVLKRRILADPEVQNDPRYDQLAPKVAKLSLVPDLGTRLEDALDGIASASGEARTQARSEALAVVEDHLRTLADDDRLRRVDGSDFGSVRVYRALTDALTELKQHLQAA